MEFIPDRSGGTVRSLAIAMSVLLICVLVFHGSFIPQVEAALLWSTDNEKGDLSDWSSDGYDGCWANGGGSCTPSTAVARSGRYSVAMTTRNNGTTNSGARLAKTKLNNGITLPDEAYYSFWLYFPQQIRVPVWWIVFEWKRAHFPSGSDFTFAVLVNNRSDGTMYFRLASNVDRTGKSRYSGEVYRVNPPSTMNITTNRWIHLECFKRWARNTTGRVTCWQDGQLLWDLQNIATEFSDTTYYGNVDGRPRQWIAASYSDNTNPGVATIYADDAVVSTTRVGTGSTISPTAPAPTSPPNPTPTRTPTPSPTTPPTVCPLKPQGDADCNGRIDLADFEQWRKEFTGTSATETADFNRDTLVNLIDFEIWRKSFL